MFTLAPYRHAHAARAAVKLDLELKPIFENLASATFGPFVVLTNDDQTVNSVEVTLSHVLAGQGLTPGMA